MTMALPPRQEGAAAWIGSELSADPSSWTWLLGDDEIAELDAAADAHAGGDHDLALIEASNFELPTLAPKLADIKTELIEGRGFTLLRGLPIERWSPRRAAAVFLGIGAHIGSARSQNAAGHVLGHVRNIGLDVNDPNVRIYQTNERQTFHTDSVDVVGLLCRQTAKSGGRSLLVSSLTIFNEMRERRPDLAAVLFETIATDRRGEVPTGMKPYFEIPVFNWHASRLSTIYQRQYIDSAARFDDVAEHSPEQVEALDLFDELANDPGLHLSMELEVGDIQFVYNHALLHDRTGFEDWPEPDRRRHLLRLWLSVDGDRELPPAYEQRYGSITPGDRGGIVLPTTHQHAPIDA